MVKFYIVELEQYFNNNGFASSEDHFKKINGDFSFTGVESCFPSEELPDTKEIEIFEVPFSFPSKEQNKFNNMELNGQEIDFPEGEYNKIHILGCSDIDHNNEILILRSNAISIEVDLPLSSWLAKAPTYNEEVGIRCSKIYSNKGEVTLFKPTIWYQQIDIKSIKEKLLSMKFRKNPSVHIFSITLEKETYYD